MPEEINPYETPAFDKFLESEEFDKLWTAQIDKFMESDALKAVQALWFESQDYYEAFDVAFEAWREAQKKN